MKRWGWKRLIWISLLLLLMTTSPLLAGSGQEERAVESEVPLEIVGERTEYSRTFLNADGSTTLEISSEPIFYQDQNGVYAEAAPRVQEIRSKDQTLSFAVQNTIYQANFGNAQEGFDFTYQGQVIQVQPLDVDDPVQGALMDQVIGYQKVWEHTDLYYEIYADSVKERMLLYNNQAPTQYRFRYILPPDSEIVETEGGLEIRVAGTEFSFFIPDPFVYDMASEVPSYEGIRRSYTLNGQECLMTYTLDEEWFSSSERVFPVTIDPSVTVSNSSVNLVFEADQRIQVDGLMKMPAMSIGKLPDRVIIKQGDASLFDDYLWHSTFTANRKEIHQSISVEKNKTYTFRALRGNGLVPFKTIYGEISIKITYYRKPVVILGTATEGKYVSGVPNLAWKLGYGEALATGAPQTNYEIVFSQNKDAIQNLSSIESAHERGAVTSEPIVGEGASQYIFLMVNKGATTFSLASDLSADLSVETREQIREILANPGNWYYRVSASNGGVYSEWSTTGSFLLDTEKPTFDQAELEFEPQENNGLQIKWGNVADNSQEPVSVRVLISNNPNDNFTLPFDYTQSTGRAQINNLEPNRKYYVRVVATDLAGNSEYQQISYVTPASVTEINDISFIKDGTGGYYPKVWFKNNDSFAYKVKIFKLGDGQSQVVHESDWILGSHHSNTLIGYVADDLTLERAKYRFYVATANEELKIWDDLSPSNPEEVEVPNGRPERPLLLYPFPGIVLRPDEEHQVKVGATSVKDYEGDPLAYEIELYKKTGELPERLGEIADDPDFIAFCHEKFDVVFPQYLNGEIMEEYDHGNEDTLSKWEEIGKGVITEPLETLGQEPGLAATAPGDGIIIDDGGIGDDPRAGEMPLRDILTLERYRELVYDIQYAYYYEEFWQATQKELFAQYLEEVYSAQIYHLVSAHQIDVETETEDVTFGFQDLQDGTYGWRVKVSEVGSPLADGNARYSEYFDFTVKMTGPPSPTFELQDLGGNPIQTTQQNMIRLGNIRYDQNETARLAYYNTYSADEMEVELGTNDYLTHTLDSVEGEHTFYLKAYDQVGNSTTFSRTLLYDKTPPTNPTLEKLTVLESDQAVILQWEPGTDRPISENIASYQVAVTLEKSYFPDGNQTKVFTVYPEVGEDLELRVDELDFNEKVTFSLVTVDTAGNDSEPTAAVVGYTRPQRSQLINPYDPARQSVGDGQHYLTLELQGVSTAGYEIFYQQLGSGEAAEHTTRSLNCQQTIAVDPNSRYRVWVRTYNNVSDTSRGRVPQYVQSEPIDIQIFNRPPVAPTLRVAEYVGTSSVTLTYSAGMDEDLDSLTYSHRITCNGDLIAESETTALSYQLTSLEDGKTYSWQVGVWDGQERDDLGERVWVYSNEVNFQVDLSSPMIRVTPDPVAGQYLSTDQITIEVTDAGSGVENIHYQWRLPNLEATSDSVSIIEEGEITSGSTISALEGEYELFISAWDQVGHEANLTKLYQVDTSEPSIENVTFDETLYNGAYFAESSAVRFQVTLAEKESMLDGFYYALVPEGINGADLTEDEMEWIAIDPAKVTLVDDLEVRYRFDQTLYNVVPVESGVNYNLYVKVFNEAGLSTDQTTRTSISIDATPPEFTAFTVAGLESGTDGVYLTALGDLNVTSSQADPETGVRKVEYGIKHGGVTEWFESLTSLKTNWDYLDGDVLQVVVRAWNSLDYVALRESVPFVVDFSAPQVEYIYGGCDPSLADGVAYRQRKSTELNLAWKMVDQTGISKYEYRIGRSPQGAEVSRQMAGADLDGWIPFIGADFEEQLVISAGEQAFSDGTYYVSVRGTDLAGHQTVVDANPITIDSTLPTAPYLSTTAYLSSETTLPILLQYSGDEEVTGYTWKLYEVIENTSGDEEYLQVATDSIVTSSKEYTGTVESNFGQGQEYYVQATASLAGELNPTPAVWSGRILVDLTAPEVVAIEVPVRSTAQQIDVSWVAEDLEYGPRGTNQGLKYEIKLGSSIGGNEYQDWRATPFARYTFNVPEIPDQAIVYVTLRVTNAAGLVTEVGSRPITIDNSLPAVPIITHGYGLYTGNTDHLDFDWALTPISEHSLDHYEVLVTRTPLIPENGEWVNVGTATSYRYQAALDNGSTYYLHVRAYGKNQLWSQGISDLLIVDFTKPDLVTVDDKKRYSADMTTLSAEFHAIELESKINYISYAVGTLEDPEAIKPFNWEPYDPTNLTITAKGNLEYGKNYYFTVMVSNVVGLPSDMATSDGVQIVKADSPRVTTIAPSGRYSRDHTQLHFTWEVDDPTMPAREFRYGLVRAQDDTPQQWFTTASSEQSCTITAAQYTGSAELPFPDGDYYLKVYAVNQLGYVTAIATSPVVTVDSTTPDQLVLQTDAVTGERFSLDWSVGQVGVSGVDEYYYALGSTPGGQDLLAWQMVDSDQAEYHGELALWLAHGQNFYLTVKVKNQAGSWSVPVLSEMILVDLAGPTQPVVTVPPFSTSHAQLKKVSISSADPDAGVAKYRWQLVPAAEKDTLSTMLVTDDQVIDPVAKVWNVTDVALNTTLTEDGEYYLAVQTWDGVGNPSEISLAGPIVVDTGAPLIELTPADPELVTNGEELKVNWTTNEPGELRYQIYFIDETGYQSFRTEGTQIITSDALVGAITFAETTPGDYVIEVAQKDIYQNASGKQSLEVRVNHQPTVTFTKRSLTLFKGADFTETVSASDQEDGDVTRYSWQVQQIECDGRLTTLYTKSSGQETMHYQFTALGQYKVRVTVTDLDGGVGSDELSITVTNTTAGEMKLNETWTGSTMLVTDDVTVPLGVTLTIEGGATVNFAPGAGLIVDGTLVCQGSEATPIRLQGSEENSLRWKGVKVNPPATLGKFEYITVQGAERGLTLMSNEGVVVEVNQATFISNQVGLHLVGGAPLITDSLFLKNTAFGIKEDGGVTPTVWGCGFNQNGQADYYDQILTWLTAEELNTLLGYQGNGIYSTEEEVTP